jgi:6-pyruvoyltetrahydropterin/6-carboxytetrahydropterin synthase
MTSITRRYHFPASHRLHSPELNSAENARLYGKCNNPFGHGHNYMLEVTAGGDVDPKSGRILPVPKLDRLVHEKVLQLLAYRNLNADVLQFANVIPTTENVAQVIVELLQQHWPAYLGGTSAQLQRVHIQETERNSFEILLRPALEVRKPAVQNENVTVHA